MEKTNLNEESLPNCFALRPITLLLNRPKRLLSGNSGISRLNNHNYRAASLLFAEQNYYKKWKSLHSVMSHRFITFISGLRFESLGDGGLGLGSSAKRTR